MISISQINARQILDSRGNPTVEVDVYLSDGSFGRAAVPSGASTGTHEAMELRDGDQKFYLGKSVKQAIKNVKSILEPVICEQNPFDQRAIDEMLISIDGTDNKSRVGANAILGVSMAIAHAASSHKDIPLYQYLSEGRNVQLPIPMMNILNGGSHADNNVDIQEFMVFPIGANSFSEALQMGTETFHALKLVLSAKGLNTSVGDEGGFAPNLSSNEEAIEVILEAIAKAGFTPGSDVFLALDVAASEIFEPHTGIYFLSSEKKKFSSNELINYYSELISKYPIISIEDGLSEDDWEGWEKLQESIGDRVQIVGDDLTVTNPLRLQEAIDRSAINAILIKLNQIGTLTETIDAMSLAKENGIGAIVSHRSGETEDTSIADLAVAMGMGQIKTGSASRTDRVCKYNQLLRIEEQLGIEANFPSLEILGHETRS